MMGAYVFSRGGFYVTHRDRPHAGAGPAGCLIRLLTFETTRTVHGPTKLFVGEKTG